MSYEVTADEEVTVWFANAWENVCDPVNGAIHGFMWHEAYNSILEYDGDGKWKITFPSEQDYIWFVLKWS